MGIRRVANAEMVKALRVISVERGHDPRDFALVAFGGAGPMHGVDLAAELADVRSAWCRTAAACFRRSAWSSAISAATG